jgi:ABC-type nitrate/sulfonate/bicarbonate transport system substrate-binding protein
MRIRSHAGLRACKSPFAIVAAVAMLATGCGSASSANAGGPTAAGNSDKTYSVSVAYYPGALASLPAFIAAGEGFFAKNHLKVNLVPISTGGAMTSALVSGSVDFANNSYDNLEEAVSKGLQVQAVVGNLVKPPFQLVARMGVALPHLSKGYPKDLTDLLHKNWGIIEVGVSEQYIEEELLAGAGYSPTAVTYVGVGLPSTALPALLHGSVDTYLSLAPMTSVLLDKHEGTVVVNFETGQGPADFRNVNYNGWWATTQEIKDSPAAVRDFARANEQAYCWYRNPANLSRVTTILRKYVKVPQLSSAQYAQMIKSNLPAYGVDINSSSINSWTHLLDSNHILSTSLSRHQLVASTAPSSYTCS